MWLLLLLYQLGLILHSRAQNPCSTHPTFREPANSDITVTCAAHRVELRILLCPIYFGGYNESLMALNDVFYRPECMGTAVWTANPPILVFHFPLTEEAITACATKIKITQETGTGLFSDYSSIQFVNISGMVNSIDPFAGIITYHSEMLYLFSCRYPLQYLINNTETSVSGVSLAIKDNNGSFISTLSLRLFQDNKYTSQLQMPSNGLQLKTRIFVEVRATNLTTRFNVLLDRCYATTSPFLINSTYYDLFVGCNRDGQTVIGLNGEGQEARFSFEAFRFVEHKNQTISTFYLHCATRLCDRAICSTLRQNCTKAARRRREVESNQGTTVSDVATVSSGPIITRVDNGAEARPVSGVSDQSQRNNTVFGVSIAVGMLGTLCLTLLAVIVFRKNKSNSSNAEKSGFFH
ncbi:zona pellucida-like domain-containing protein 1 [Colossoma macropomum]|uniref:zona pellucida-like domain-containing protein 1 n=1 Tax=Colossoma macropomum TaxID=42526 RepID=UPI0018646140|nr:zona pellucida-like domain-containing protein 1 [Colossoma macropomum]